MSFARRFLNLARAELLHLRRHTQRPPREFAFEDDAPEDSRPWVSEQVRGWYANLELEVGASVGQVRQAYRSLMRRYHPDRFAGDKAAAEVAHRLSQGIREAHDGLLRWFETTSKP